MVHLLHVLHTAILHFLWHAGSWCDPEFPYSLYSFICILWRMEPFLRICYPKNSKLNLNPLYLADIFTLNDIFTNDFYFFPFLMQRMPFWWRWYYWACPVAYTLYGMLTSQYGDVNEPLDTNETVAEFITSYFGYRRDFLGVVAFMTAGFAFLFAGLFGASIKLLNFQKR